MRRWMLNALLLIVGLTAATAATATVSAAEYQAGFAKVSIMPDEPTWLSGYASRTKPAEGKVHDLYAKAAAFEDAEGPAANEWKSWPMNRQALTSGRIAAAEYRATTGELGRNLRSCPTAKCATEGRRHLKETTWRSRSTIPRPACWCKESRQPLGRTACDALRRRAPRRSAQG